MFRWTSHKNRNELIPVWDFRPAWKQVLFTWRFISAAFQNDPIFWWICVSISFWSMFTLHFITQNEISFLSKWLQSNNTRNEIQVHMRFNRNIQQVCAYSFHFGLILFTWKSYAILKFHFGQNDRYKIHTGLSFISLQFMWIQVKSWLNTDMRFSTEVKSHTGLSSFCLSCERTVTIFALKNLILTGCRKHWRRQLIQENWLEAIMKAWFYIQYNIFNWPFFSYSSSRIRSVRYWKRNWLFWKSNNPSLRLLNSRLTLVL